MTKNFAKKDFQRIWREEIPEPFTYDLCLRDKIKNLVKFIHLTYSAGNVTNPFYAHDRISDEKLMKRMMQRKVRKEHGV